MTLVGLSIAGPKARKVLEKLTDEDVSNAAFRFMDFREMDGRRGAVHGQPHLLYRRSRLRDLDGAGL
jgi:dimethylglycine dehydrogenase